MREIMNVYREFDSMEKMAKIVSELEYEYITHVYSVPGRYREDHTYGSKVIDDRKIWYVKWTAWEKE